MMRVRLTNDDLGTLTAASELETNKGYLHHLRTAVAGGQCDIGELLEWGIRQIPRGVREFSNPDLGTYFFRLSEIGAVPQELSDFALDVSLWCDGAAEASQFFLHFDPHAEFAKIKPL